jgi:hypothetical protein
METSPEWRDELLDVADELMAAVPWEVVPPRPSIALEVKSLGIDDARIAVMGHNRETFGLMVFFSAEDQRTFEAHAGAPVADDVTLPRCLSVNVMPMPQVAGAEASPRSIALTRIFEDQTQRLPTDREMTLAVAAARGLCRFVGRKAGVLDDLTSWVIGIEGRYSVPVRTKKVSTHLTARMVLHAGGPQPSRTPRARAGGGPAKRRR